MFLCVWQYFTMYASTKLSFLVFLWEWVSENGMWLQISATLQHFEQEIGEIDLLFNVKFICSNLFMKY